LEADIGEHHNRSYSVGINFRVRFCWQVSPHSGMWTRGRCSELEHREQRFTEFPPAECTKWRQVRALHLYRVYMEELWFAIQVSTKRLTKTVTIALRRFMSARELYRPSGHHYSAKLLPRFWKTDVTWSAQWVRKIVHLGFRDRGNNKYV
jgi:hypothetical protein